MGVYFKRKSPQREVYGGINRHSNTKNTTNNDSDIFISKGLYIPPPGELACTPNINHQTEKVRGGINRHSNTKNTTNNDSDIFNSKGLYIPPTNWHVLRIQA